MPPTSPPLAVAGKAMIALPTAAGHTAHEVDLAAMPVNCRVPMVSATTWPMMST